MVGRSDERRGLVLLAFLLAGFLIYIAFQHWAYDDPFITFRYADNLRAGQGFVYNAGERVLSTTTPLYALLLTGLGYIWPDLPRLSNLISALSLALGGFFIYLTGRRWGEPLAGWIGGVLLLFFPLMASTFGAETCFYVMLAVGALTFYAREQYELALALAALATLTRADGVLVAVVLAGDYVISAKKPVFFRSSRPRPPWFLLLLFALLVAPWHVFCWVYFGSPFPATLAAKQLQGQMAISQGFAPGFLRLLKGYAQQPLYWLHGCLALLGVWYMARKARRWLLWLAWGALYFVSYTLLGVSRYFWYYAPLIPVLISLVGLGVAQVSRWLALVLAGRWSRAAALAVFLILLLWPQGAGLVYMRAHPDPRAEVYREAGRWLAQNTPPEASVGTLEVGIIGYYARRRMVGFAGLIQPDVARQMKQQTTYQDTASWAMRRYRPGYLALNTGWFPELMQGVVAERCKQIQSFTAQGYQGALLVYDCNWGE
jgi:hypothetical protein